MTNGGITISEKEHIISFNVKDGSGIKYLQRSGIKVAIITGRKSLAVEKRARELNIEDVYQLALKKLTPYKEIIKKYDMKPVEVAYVGDDLPDLPVMRKVGVSFAVADAVEEVRKSADYVTKQCGGEGAVREVAEVILKLQKKWKGLVQYYLE
jgi:YrbI family 3-deoxy-D-manno-octulosonate 8-phosphate phosphatase